MNYQFFKRVVGIIFRGFARTHNENGVVKNIHANAAFFMNVISWIIRAPTKTLQIHVSVSHPSPINDKNPLEWEL